MKFILVAAFMAVAASVASACGTPCVFPLALQMSVSNGVVCAACPTGSTAALVTGIPGSTYEQGICQATTGAVAPVATTSRVVAPPAPVFVPIYRPSAPRHKRGAWWCKPGHGGFGSAECGGSLPVFTPPPPRAGGWIPGKYWCNKGNGGFGTPACRKSSPVRSPPPPRTGKWIPGKFYCNKGNGGYGTKACPNTPQKHRRHSKRRLA